MVLSTAYALSYWQQYCPYSSGSGITLPTLASTLWYQQWHLHYRVGKGIGIVELAMPLQHQRVVALEFLH